MNSAYVSVGTSATALNATDATVTADARGNSILIKNPSGSVTVYIGGSDVTADTTAGTGGYPLAPGGELAVTVNEGEIVYGRVAASTQSVNVLRQGV